MVKKKKQKQKQQGTTATSPTNIAKITKNLGKFPKGKVCTDYQCEAWKQTALEHKSERYRKWIIAIVWIIISFITSFMIVTWLNLFYTGIMNKIPDPVPIEAFIRCVMISLEMS